MIRRRAPARERVSAREEHDGAFTIDDARVRYCCYAQIVSVAEVAALSQQSRVTRALLLR